MKDEFKKFDTGKPMPSLVEPEFILGTAKVLTFGAQKYGIRNWQLASGETDMQRYKDALLRHILEYLDGKHIDTETQLSHLYHASCNLMFLDYFDRTKAVNKPKYKPVTIDEAINILSDPDSYKDISEISNMLLDGLQCQQDKLPDISCNLTDENLSKDLESDLESDLIYRIPATGISKDDYEIILESCFQSVRGITIPGKNGSICYRINVTPCDHFIWQKTNNENDMCIYFEGSIDYDEIVFKIDIERKHINKLKDYSFVRSIVEAEVFKILNIAERENDMETVKKYNINSYLDFIATDLNNKLAGYLQDKIGMDPCQIEVSSVYVPTTSREDTLLEFKINLYKAYCMSVYITAKEVRSKDSIVCGIAGKLYEGAVSKGLLSEAGYAMSRFKYLNWHPIASKDTQNDQIKNT